MRYRKLLVGEALPSRHHYTHRAYISLWVLQNTHPQHMSLDISPISLITGFNSISGRVVKRILCYFGVSNKSTRNLFLFSGSIDPYRMYSGIQCNRSLAANRSDHNQNDDSASETVSRSSRGCASC
jgi:hypothetical protein